MKEISNTVRVRFPALSENESVARVITTGFLMHQGVTPAALADIKTVVSEAVTNAIVHGYRGRDGARCPVFLELTMYADRTLVVKVRDKGRGIEDIEKAMQPFFTTDREGERSGMGLPIMDAFTDQMKITSSPAGTRVVMKKRLP